MLLGQQRVRNEGPIVQVRRFLAVCGMHSPTSPVPCRILFVHGHRLKVLTGEVLRDSGPRACLTLHMTVYLS